MERMSSSALTSSGSGVADDVAAEESPSEVVRPLELVISDRTDPSIPLVMERTGKRGKDKVRVWWEVT